MPLSTESRSTFPLLVDELTRLDLAVRHKFGGGGARHRVRLLIVLLLLLTCLDPHQRVSGQVSRSAKVINGH